MLDNPDKHGIYPTGKCYDEFEDYIKEIKYDTDVNNWYPTKNVRAKFEKLDKVSHKKRPEPLIPFVANSKDITSMEHCCVDKTNLAVLPDNNAYVLLMEDATMNDVMIFEDRLRKRSKHRKHPIIITTNASVCIDADKVKKEVMRARTDTLYFNPKNVKEARKQNEDNMKEIRQSFNRLEKELALRW